MVLYIVTQKKWKFLNEKNTKITKLAHAFKGYACFYNVEILNSELQLKDTESAIKNKLKIQLPQIKGFKFMPILVLILKRRKVKIKQNMTHFIRTQKQKQLTTKLTLMIIYLNKSILQSYQTYKNL